jgi:hypothetical protein
VNELLVERGNTRLGVVFFVEFAADARFAWAVSEGVGDG